MSFVLEVISASNIFFEIWLLCGGACEYLVEYWSSKITHGFENSKFFLVIFLLGGLWVYGFMGSRVEDLVRLVGLEVIERSREHREFRRFKDSKIQNSRFKIQDSSRRSEGRKSNVSYLVCLEVIAMPCDALSLSK